MKSPSAGTPYFSAVVRRAETVYRDIFADSRCGFVVAVETKYVEIPPFANSFRRRQKDPPGLFELDKAEPLGIGRPGGKATVTVVRPDEKEICKLKWTEIAPMAIDYGRIFEAIANQDFWSRSPRISGNVYFVDPARHVILHMYDDRGMDVIATDRTSLQPLYSRRTDWILEHNRSRIDETFRS